MNFGHFSIRLLQSCQIRFRELEDKLSVFSTSGLCLWFFWSFSQCSLAVIFFINVHVNTGLLGLIYVAFDLCCFYWNHVWFGISCCFFNFIFAKPTLFPSQHFKFSSKKPNLLWFVSQTTDATKKWRLQKCVICLAYWFLWLLMFRYLYCLGFAISFFNSELTLTILFVIFEAEQWKSAITDKKLINEQISQSISHFRQ